MGCSPNGKSQFLSHSALVSSLGQPHRQRPFFHHLLAQTLAGSSAPDDPGKPGALMGHMRPGVFGGGQLRPRSEPQEEVR